MKPKKKFIIGERITKRLAEIAQSQEWLASEIGLSSEAVSKWCRGDGLPKLENLLTVASLLKCKAGYLLGDYDDESIAETVRIMQSVSPVHRPTILGGVIAVVSTLPKTSVKNAA